MYQNSEMSNIVILRCSIYFTMFQKLSTKVRSESLCYIENKYQLKACFPSNSYA